MNTELFLQTLRDLPLEEGKVFIQEHIDELSDHAAVGNLIADEALRLLYSPFVSLKLAELLIFYGEYVQHTSSHALGLKAKGDALVQIGHFQAAMESLDVAGDEFLRLGDEGNWARSRISWMLACAWLGRVEEALREANRARKVFLRLGEPYWACAIDHNTAVIYENMGRYMDAVNIYERMRAIYPTLTGQNENSISQRIALAEMNEAVNLAWLGKFKEAYHLQMQSQARYAELNEVDLVITTEVNLADLDYSQGYYGSALRRYYQARDSLIQHNIENPILLAELKLWMANCLVKLNRSQEASKLAFEVVEAERQTGFSLNTIYALHEYATTLVSSGRPKEALAVLDDVLMLCTLRGMNHQAAITKLQQAELLLEGGSFDEALHLAQFVKDYFELNGLVSYAVRASLVIAGALMESIKSISHGRADQQQMIREAILLCEKIVKLARRNNIQEAVYKSHYLLGKLWTLEHKPAKAFQHYNAAIVQIERMLDDLVYDLSPQFLHRTWAVYEDMIAHCLQQSQYEKALNYLEQARSMALRQYLTKSKTSRDTKEQQTGTLQSNSHINSAQIFRLQQELKYLQEQYRDYSVLLADIDMSVSSAVDQDVIENELKRCETKISELFEQLYLNQFGSSLKSRKRNSAQRSENQLDVLQLFQHLSPDQVLLEYFLYHGGLVIFVGTREHLIAREIPDGFEQLERLLPLLHAHLDPRGWSDIQRPPEKVVLHLLNKLYNLLVAPIAEFLPSTPGDVTIIPYGPLHQLPFHALHDGVHFMVEKFRINYLPASRILKYLDTYENGDRAVSNVKETPSRPPLVFGYSGNGHLQCINDEAKTVAYLLNSVCYLEDEATIVRLIEMASGSPIIHLATHGQSRLDAPNFSYVRLADGHLNAIDAFSLDLRACELVTLSGCETGLALSGGGDEQLGLGRAFLAAGTSSLIMSLWSVEDSATNELMKMFYQNLLKGESKVQALRAAQCQIMQNSSSGYTHPYFWAAFRLIGDVGPLKFMREGELSFAYTSESLKK